MLNRSRSRNRNRNRGREILAEKWPKSIMYYTWPEHGEWTEHLTWCTWDIVHRRPEHRKHITIAMEGK